MLGDKSQFSAPSVTNDRQQVIERLCVWCILRVGLIPYYPKTRIAPQATRSYSWISLPSRSGRRSRPVRIQRCRCREPEVSLSGVSESE
jgi:hypothetical protein